MSIHKAGRQLQGSNDRPILLDITYDTTKGKCPVIVYAHGFNGFKDWGNFDLIARQFVQAGFTFVKFNFSHNGTTPEQPEIFADLEAFAQNNYSRELFDLGKVLDWLNSTDNDFAACIDNVKTGLIGHSMGGGFSIIKTAEDKRIRALATWAAIAYCTTPWGSWPEEKIGEWKNTGVQYYFNGRTHQQMPMYYQLYEDFQQNRDRLDILQAIAGIHIPILICHGTQDSSVPVASAQQLHKAAPASELFLVDSDHVFGRKHPWPSTELPEAMQKVTDKSIHFFREALS